MFTKIKQFFTLVLLLLALLGCYYVYAYFLPKTQIADLGSPDAVLKQVQSLNRLESTSYTVEKIVNIGTEPQANVVMDFLFGDKLLLIATGEVVAGVDLNKIAASNITKTDVGYKIILPPAEIFTVKLDETQTKVYDRKTGILDKPKTDLESRARQTAVTQIRASACTGGILNKANDGAKQNLDNLFKALNYKVEVVPTIGECN